MVPQSSSEPFSVPDAVITTDQPSSDKEVTNKSLPSKDSNSASPNTFCPSHSVTVCFHDHCCHPRQSHLCQPFSAASAPVRLVPGASAMAAWEVGPFRAPALPWCYSSKKLKTALGLKGFWKRMEGSEKGNYWLWTLLQEIFKHFRRSQKWSEVGIKFYSLIKFKEKWQGSRPGESLNCTWTKPNSFSPHIIKITPRYCKHGKGERWAAPYWPLGAQVSPWWSPWDQILFPPQPRCCDQDYRAYS